MVDTVPESSHLALSGREVREVALALAQHGIHADWGMIGEGVPYARDGGREAPKEEVPLPPRRKTFGPGGLVRRGSLPPSPGVRRTHATSC